MSPNSPREPKPISRHTQTSIIVEGDGALVAFDTADVIYVMPAARGRPKTGSTALADAAA